MNASKWLNKRSQVNKQIKIVLNKSKWSFIKRQSSSTSSDNEWQRVVQRVTTNDNEWQRTTTSDDEWQRVTTNGTTNDNEWQRMATSDNEWSFRLIFVFFQMKEEAPTKHPKENNLNIEEDLLKKA